MDTRKGPVGLVRAACVAPGLGRTRPRARKKRPGESPRRARAGNASHYAAECTPARHRAATGSALTAGSDGRRASDRWGVRAAGRAAVAAGRRATRVVETGCRSSRPRARHRADVRSHAARSGVLCLAGRPPPGPPDGRSRARAGRRAGPVGPTAPCLRGEHVGDAGRDGYARAKILAAAPLALPAPAGGQVYRAPSRFPILHEARQAGKHHHARARAGGGRAWTTSAHTRRDHNPSERARNLEVTCLQAYSHEAADQVA
jgi:hypothetical protein